MAERKGKDGDGLIVIIKKCSVSFQLFSALCRFSLQISEKGEVEFCIEEFLNQSQTHIAERKSEFFFFLEDTLPFTVCKFHAISSLCQLLHNILVI